MGDLTGICRLEYGRQVVERFSKSDMILPAMGLKQKIFEGCFL